MPRTPQSPFVALHVPDRSLLLAQGTLDEAIGHFAEAVRLNPGFAEAHNNLGNAFLAQGKLGKAVSHYSAAVRIQPDPAFARYGLGSALAGQGRTGEAIEQPSRSVELEPDFVEALASLAWILATDSDSKVRDGARAVALAERACELTGGEHPLLLDTLAAAYAECGEFVRAQKTAQKAIALAESAGRLEWAQDIEKRLEMYNQGLSFHAGSQ